MTPLPAPMLAALAGLTLTAAVFDILYRRIPNWLVAPALLAAFAAHGVLDGMAGAREAALGAGLAALVYMPLYLLRGVGAGDVKLMLAVGAWAGPANWLVIFAFTAVLGGIIAVVLLLARGRLGRSLANVLFILLELGRLRPPYRRRPDLDVANPKAVRLPHGAVIALGTCLFLGCRLAGI